MSCDHEYAAVLLVYVWQDLQGSVIELANEDRFEREWDASQRCKVIIDEVLLSLTKIAKKGNSFSLPLKRHTFGACQLRRRTYPSSGKNVGGISVLLEFGVRGLVVQCLSSSGSSTSFSLSIV